MKKVPFVMTPDSMRSASQFSKMSMEAAIKLAKRLVEDLDRDKRLLEHTCKTCFYRERVAGAAMTQRDCGCCGVEQTYSSTRTDAFCTPCSAKHALCKRCGGDIDMREDRIGWPVPDVLPS